VGTDGNPRQFPYSADSAYSALIAAAAISAFVIGVAYGTFAASDTDPYGYVSEAELIASGALRVDQRAFLTMPWRDAELSFIPDSYRRGTEPGFIVPTYPPGLPLAMAAALRISGARDAVYYVVPLFGALAVWMTARLGTRAGSRGIGAATALLVATSPIFLYQVVQPTSDVPAAALWTTSLACALGSSRRSAVASGLAASGAILTRPNLVPLAALIAAGYFWNARSGDGVARRAALTQLALFSFAIVPACLTIAAINAYLYGGPLRSGYAAPLSELYQLQHVMFNLQRYPRWLLETHSPFVFVGLAAPLLFHRSPRVWLLFTFVVVVFISYFLFGYFENWVYIRFLLPALPALFTLGLLVGAHVLRRIAMPPATSNAVAAMFVIVLASWQAVRAEALGAFVTRFGEDRYAEVGEYIAKMMPPNAIYIAGLHSGSIRHYSGRTTVNFNTLNEHSLQDAVDALTKMGHRVYFVVEEGEQAGFRWRFDTHTNLGKLDWPPAHHTERHVKVGIYDPADRALYIDGQPVVTFNISDITRPVIVQRPPDPAR
jgi:hypothetical protein